MYLNRHELTRLTGYTQRSAVIRWLDRHEWPYVVGEIDGWPRVLRRFHDDKLMGLGYPRQGKKSTGPNWSVSP